MKIYLGTTSDDKRRFLEKELLAYYGTSFSICAHPVPSDVSEQPLTEEETLQGAVNRARNLRNFFLDGDMYVGMEGGGNKIRGWFGKFFFSLRSVSYS